MSFRAIVSKTSGTMREGRSELKLGSSHSCKAALVKQGCLDDYKKINIICISKTQIDRPVVVRAVASSVEHAVEGQGYQT